MTNFIPVASTRFLAEQMQYQAGRPVGDVRTLALYVDASYQPPVQRVSEFLILRTPFVFWDYGCILNYFAILNGLRVNFIHSDSVKRSSSYRPWSRWHGVIFLPYDQAQMRFYEFYAMGMPIFLPSHNLLPSFIFRGVTSLKDYDVRLDSPFVDMLSNPFDGHKDWVTAYFWSQMTHYVELPGLYYFDSYAGLFSMLRELVDDPEIGQRTFHVMKKRGLQDLLVAANFWRSAIQFNQHEGVESNTE